MTTEITKSKAPTNEKSHSCVVGSINVRSCLNFDAMWKAHPLNWSPMERTPFRQVSKKNKHTGSDPFAALQDEPLPPPIYSDQCAIKMSIALQDCGLSLETFPKNRSELREVFAIKKKYRGALAAEELAIWLIKALGQPNKYPPHISKKSVEGRKGIIFFKDFWTRQNEATQQGDHIDLWNGSTMPQADPRVLEGSLNYFDRSKEVWFWEIK
jgi:hypothetical protein